MINSLLTPAGLTCLYIHLDCDPLGLNIQTHSCMHVRTHTRDMHTNTEGSSQKSGGLCHLWLDTLPWPSGFRNVLNGRKVEGVLRMEEEEGLSFWKNNTGNTEPLAVGADRKNMPYRSFHLAVNS